MEDAQDWEVSSLALRPGSHALLASVNVRGQISLCSIDESGRAKLRQRIAPPRAPELGWCGLQLHPTNPSQVTGDRPACARTFGLPLIGFPCS